MAGLYIHIPFRERDRAYDDAFVSARAGVNYEAFTDAIAREIRQQAEAHGGELPIRSVYAGGGRPSLIPLEAMVPLLRAVSNFETDDIEEVSAELSPKDATQRYVKGLTTMGFNRLVVAALSFDDAELHTIDAPHTVHDIYQCLEHARTVGIENISLDVTFGWPESTLNSWKQTLKTVVECEVPHVTLLEWPSYATNDAQELLRTKQYRYALQYLQEHGFEPYEISHFAQPGYRSRHNKNYWAHGSFLGIGPAAHSFWWYPESENPRRWANVQDVEAYAQLLAEGERIGNQGAFFAPTVLGEVPREARVMNEEPFGPVAPVARMASLDDMLEEANRLPFGLAAYAFTSDRKTAGALREGVEAGMLALNSLLVSTPETPFGGINDSGYGSEGGIEGLEAFQRTRFLTDTDL